MWLVYLPILIYHRNQPFSYRQIDRSSHQFILWTLEVKLLARWAGSHQLFPKMGPLSRHLLEPFIRPFERSSNYNPSETCLFQAIYGGLQLQPHLYGVCAHLASPPKLWSSILESCQPPRRFLCPRSATKPLSRTGGSPSAFKFF